MAKRLDYTVLEMIEDAARTVKTTPLNLGGTAGAGGGIGGPPGGFVGQLPQYRVAYDTLEAATMSTMPSGLSGASGWSLVDNLNHIRFRIEELESGASIMIENDNTLVAYPDTTVLHFSGAGVTTNNLGGGEVQVVITATGSGGGGVTDHGALTGLGDDDHTQYHNDARGDARYLKLDVSNDPLTGKLDIIPSPSDAGLYVEVNSDDTGIDMEQYFSNTNAGADLFFGYQETNNGTISSIFLDGIRWKTGSGSFTGDWIYLADQNVEKFSVDKDGGVNTADWFYADGARFPQYLHFAAYAHSPWNQGTDGTYPYLCTVDRLMTFVKWSQACNVGGTNNGSNYWTFDLYDVTGNLINSINTSGMSGSNTWTLLTDTTWSTASVTTSSIAIYIVATKTGAPGNYTLACPQIEVYW